MSGLARLAELARFAEISARLLNATKINFGIPVSWRWDPWAENFLFNRISRDSKKNYLRTNLLICKLSFFFLNNEEALKTAKNEVNDLKWWKHP